jgi:hypothetical protein
MYAPSVCIVSIRAIDRAKCVLCCGSFCLQAIDPNLVKLAEAYSIAAEKLGLLADATGACHHPACLPCCLLRVYALCRAQLPLPQPATND